MHDISWERQIKQENGFFTRAARLSLLILHLLAGVAQAALLLPRVGTQRRTAMIRTWSVRVLAILRIELQVSGQVPDASGAGALFVANHISWLDIYLLNAICPVRFVSKAEVRSWPVIGWLAAKVGTLFIERTRRHDTGRMNQTVTEALIRGDQVALFPEGTTSDGTLLRPFHAPLLQAAIDGGSRVRPVAIRYTRPDGSPSLAPAYVDDLSFGESLSRILSEPRLQAEIAYLDPLPTEGQTRRELAAMAEQAIASALNLAAPCRKPGKPADPPGVPPSDDRPTGSPCPAPSGCCEPPVPAPTSGQK